MSLPLYVTFSDEPVECAEPNFLQNRDVKLPTTGSSSTSRLHCSGGSFVSSQGEVVVKSEGGAWSAQPTGQCGEHLLRFYLDFPEGAARNDVSLPAGRLYFSSACWDKDERAAAEQHGHSGRLGSARARLLRLLRGRLAALDGSLPQEERPGHRVPSHCLECPSAQPPKSPIPPPFDPPGAGGGGHPQGGD